MSKDVKEWLHDARNARIMSVFDNACNIIADNRKIISLAIQKNGNGPFHIILPEIQFKAHIRAGSTVTLSPHTLHIGSLRIELDSAAVWEPAPDWTNLREFALLIRQKSGLIIQWLQENAPVDSFAMLADTKNHPSDAAGNPFLQAAQQPARQFIDSLIHADGDSCSEAASQLAGLGPGLTPAGDDWLMGALIAGYILLPTEKAFRVSHAVSDTAQPLTTPLSGAYLQSVSEGKCSEPWHCLLTQLACGSDTAVLAATEAILNHGHTSGADALGGFMAAQAYHQPV